MDNIATPPILFEAFPRELAEIDCIERMQTFASAWRKDDRLPPQHPQRGSPYNGRLIAKKQGLGETGGLKRLRRVRAWSAIRCCRVAQPRCRSGGDRPYPHRSRCINL